ncbi:LppX_LprAFG lipoprotein [Streptomyces sp. NPDC057877]|uniref:LppX_LprAFG lipoprotein n=1 Tax=Streptomyces sp. NPDC057877 TaxID=3346269 RepID=UPI00369E6DF9
MGLSVRTRRTRRGAMGAGLSALLLAAGAVGCSSGDGGDSPEMEPAAAVAAAAKNAEEIKSLRYRISGDIPEQGTIDGEASMSLDPLAMDMKMSVEGASPTQSGEAEIRLLDQVMYIGGGAEMAKELDGKSWMKMDLSALGEDNPLNLDELGAGQAGQNPAAESGFLAGAEDVEKVGTETVDGVETTHYKGTVDLDDLRKATKGESRTLREQREKSIEQYEKMGVESLKMDMWIDGEDRAKQFRMQGDATGGPLDMTVTFLDYNQPVDIEAPPAADTVDFAEMMEEAMASES